MEAGDDDNNNNSIEGENDSCSSTPDMSVESGSSIAQRRDYPPGSAMIASTKEGNEITLRLICRGKVVSSATKEGLVSFSQVIAARVS